MGGPRFKDCIAADVTGVFLNPAEFAEPHTINGRVMTVQIDENELLERDKSKVMGTSQSGTYKARRLIFVDKAEFGPRPAQGVILELDGREFQVSDCTEEAGMLAIELGAVRS